MARRRHTPGQIIARLRQAEVALAQVCKALGVTELTYHRRRKEGGGMQVEQATRLKRPEQEAARPGAPWPTSGWTISL